MRSVFIAPAAVLLCGCATSAAKVDTRPAYTRASIADRTTAELAALLLDPAEAGTVEDHEVRRPFWPGGPLWLIHFFARPRPIAGDICARDFIHVSFSTVGAYTDVTMKQDVPTRVDNVHRSTRLALAPGCAPLPDRNFATIGLRTSKGPPLTIDEGIRILRTLADARAAAAGGKPLPFRLRCSTDHSRQHFTCPADVRALLASLPIHRAITVDRAPFDKNILCGPPDPETGESVEVEVRTGGTHLWEVRLNDMGTSKAEIVMSWRPARGIIVC